MIETIELGKPVMIDGVEVRELTYDIDAVTSEQFVEADVLAAGAAAKRGRMAFKVAEVDTAFHYYLGVMAVLAANPRYAVEDVERVKGPDVMKVMRVGRGFTTAGAEEDGDEDFAAAGELEEATVAGASSGYLPEPESGDES